MDNQELERLKSQILQEKVELEQLKASEVETTKAVKLDQSTVGRLSRMDAMQSQAIAKETKRRREIQRTRIEAALERIEEGEYGYCANCDEEINIKRLNVDPATPFCIDCASKM